MMIVATLRDTRVMQISATDFIVEALDDCMGNYFEVLPEGKYSNFKTSEEALIFARSIDGQCLD